MTSQTSRLGPLKYVARRLAPATYERLAMSRLGARSYSQEGEDRVLARFFEGIDRGFYVDVGAHHPIRFSNTFMFYLRGWRGINIDAMPASMKMFDKYRAEDVNLECGIGSVRGDIPFYVFNEPALNSFDESLSRSREGAMYRVVEVIQVPVRPLAEVLAPYLSRFSGPSFLSVDVEGRDLDVLTSNDWQAFRPTFVLAESLGSTIAEAASGEVTRFLAGQGYQFLAKTMNTAFYRSSGQPTP